MRVELCTSRLNPPYKKSVDFRISVDDIETAPHEDKNFALLLPQTNEFIHAMLKIACRDELPKND
jgi:hypothetical protein